jgi:hypothetical protein
MQISTGAAEDVGGFGAQSWVDPALVAMEGSMRVVEQSMVI